MRLRVVASLALLASTLSAGCSSSKPASGYVAGPPGGEGGVGVVGDGDGGTLFTGDSGPITTDECSDAAKLVYVVSGENDLYSFQPASLVFTKIGTLACPSAPGATPNSMAIDRSGLAWVNYSDGSLFKVSTADASCTATSFVPGQSGFVKFGMAFSSNSAGSADESLYVCGLVDPVVTGGIETGKGFAKIDLASMTLTPTGDFGGSLQGIAGELTGTGDARLYGFFSTMPATLALVDKTSAATPTPQMLAGVNTGSDWAFSFYGGDFWFYTADDTNMPGSTSNVTRLKTSTDNSISVVKSQIGFRIVGAGVSTCAPTAPVK